MYKPPAVPVEQTGRAAIRVPCLLSLKHEGSPRSEQQNSGRTRLVYLQGTIMTSRGLLHVEPGDFREGDASWLRIDESVEAVGAFLAVYKEAGTNNLIVLSDFHGFQKVFYSDLGNGSASVSDSLTTLSQNLRNTGRQIDINLPNLIGQYGSFNALLNHHAFSTQTIVEDIHVLRSDQVLRISPTSVKAEPRPRFTDPKNRNYEQLISDALRRGADFVAATLEWDVPDRMLFLSGGRDSRSVLAMAIAGGTEREFPVFAKPPPAGTSTFSQKLSLDRELSGQLVDKFNLDVWDDKFNVKLSNGETEREWWLSHWAGVLHDYNSPKRGSLVPSVRLIGAMGANYRTKVPDFVAHMRDTKFQMSPDSFDDDFSTFFDDICPRHPGSNNDAWEEAREMFHTSLTYEGVGEALWERLDAFSEVFRMSAHFGGTNVEQSANTWNLNILGIPELTYAASMLPRRERADGQVWKDLHALVDERLNEVPYEFQAKSLRGDYSAVGGSATHVDWTAADIRHSANLERNTNNIETFRGATSPRVDHVACKRLLLKHEELLSTAVGPARTRHLLMRVQQRSTLMKRLRGKLELLDELVDPQVSWNHVRVAIGPVHSSTSLRV